MLKKLSLLLTILMCSSAVFADAFEKKVSMSGSLRLRGAVYSNNATSDTMGISRARIKLAGDVLPGWSFLIQPDFAALSTGGAVVFADAYAQYKNELVTLQIGQFLVPFAYTSSKYKTIYATGFVPSHYGVVINARDYGLNVSGVVPVAIDFGYCLALVNGTGAADTDKSKDLVGRVNYKNNLIDIGFSGYYGQEGAKAKRDAAIDLELNLEPATVVSEYVTGHDKTAAKELQEVSLQVSALVNGLEPLVRAERYNADLSIAGNVVNTYTIGLGFILDKSTKFIVNYNIIDEETVAIDNNCLLVELQTQI